MLKPRFIYGLSDPRSGEMRYIGATVNPIQRFRNHVAHRHRQPKFAYTSVWIKELEQAGLKPIFTILEEVPGESWEESERAWIAHFRDQGADLLNHGDGGESGPALPVGQWARGFDACISCGRTDRIHSSGGLCTACYNRKRHRETKQPDRPYYEWALDYPACVECGTTERPHKGYGRCENCYSRYKRSLKPPKPPRWAKDYDECVICHSTDRPHQGKGLCKRCHGRERYRALNGVQEPRVKL